MFGVELRGVSRPLLRHKICYFARVARPGSSVAGSDRVDEAQAGLSDVVDEVSTPTASSSSTTRDSTFAQLFRNSKFVQLGDFDGRVVIGKIVHRIYDDLYIDMGLKFNAVCKSPAVNAEKYVVGGDVLLRLHDPELSERFLGAKRDITLLEANATLLGLYDSRQSGRKKAESGSKKEPIRS